MPCNAPAAVGFCCGCQMVSSLIGCVIGAIIMTGISDGFSALSKRLEEGTDFKCNVYDEGGLTCPTDDEKCTNKPTDLETGMEAMLSGYRCFTKSNSDKVTCPCLKDELKDVAAEPGNANWMNLSVGAVEAGSGSPAPSPWSSFAAGDCVQISFGESSDTNGLVGPVGKQEGQMTVSEGGGGARTSNTHNSNVRRMTAAENTMTKWQTEGSAGNLDCCFVPSSKDFIMPLVAVGLKKDTIIDGLQKVIEPISGAMAALWIAVVVSLFGSCGCIGTGVYFCCIKKS